MPVCFFDNNTDKYNCEYEIQDDYIEVVVDYHIVDEIEEVNGIRCIGANTRYKERDILIIDHKFGKSFLLKNAYYIGNTSVFGTPDGGAKTRFKTYTFFWNTDYKKLVDLPPIPKLKSIRIYSKVMEQLIGHPTLERKIDDNKYEVRLSKKDCSSKRPIKSRNINNISTTEKWVCNEKENKITVTFEGYIELELRSRVNFDLLYQYINELCIYMQLYIPNSFSVDNVEALVDDDYYNIVVPRSQFDSSRKNVRKSVDEDLLDFLEKCYAKIPYRNSKAEIRNIPYIINQSKYVEENFLTFYRFIECYYKRQQIPGVHNAFIGYSINENYSKRFCLSDEQKEDYTFEIISLRNHYVHSGYFIKKSCLKIRYNDINGHNNPKNHTACDVNVKWILERTEILYDIAIDIIFSRMLDYDDYSYIN